MVAVPDRRPDFRPDNRPERPQDRPQDRPRFDRNDRFDRDARRERFRRDDDLGPSVLGFGDDIPAFMLITARKRPEMTAPVTETRVEIAEPVPVAKQVIAAPMPEPVAAETVVQEHSETPVAVETTDAPAKTDSAEQA